MIAVESPARALLPPRAVWSLMAGLYAACGIARGVECALTNLLGAVTDDYVAAAGRREES